MAHGLHGFRPANAKDLSTEQIQEIIDSEALLRQAQSMADIGNWEWDIANDRIYWSDQLYRHFGLDPKEFDATFDAFMERIHPDDRVFVNQTVQRAFTDHQPWAFEHRIVRPDGEERYVFGQGAVEVKGGQPIRMFGTEQDITEQRRMKDRDRLQGQWFRQSLDLLCITDGEGRFVELNPQWEETLGWPLDDLLGTPFVDLVHPEDVEPTMEEARKLWGNHAHETIGFTNRYRCKDGSYRTLRWTSGVDVETGHLYAVARDISPELEESERFQALLDAAPDAIILTDSMGAITYSNRQAEEMFGYKPEELEGKKIEVLVPKRFRKVHPSHREGYHHDPKTRPMGADLDLWAVNKDGTEFPVEISLAPLNIKDGRVVMAAIRDVTDRKKAEETERRAYKQELEIARLEEANQFRMTLLNTVAHELNTPLTPLQLQAHVLSQNLENASESQEKSMQILNRNIRRLKLLVSDILDMSRMQADRLELRLEPVPVTELMEETRETYSEAAAQAKVTVNLEAVENLTVMADRDRLTQVMYNLLGNAIKFSPEDSVIELGARSNSDHMELWVRDEGMGITDEEAKGLFEPFGQVHKNQTQPGTGLGLYISKGIVEHHGGQLTMTSGGRDQGTTFTVRLPLTPTSSKE